MGDPFSSPQHAMVPEVLVQLKRLQEKIPPITIDFRTTLQFSHFNNNISFEQIVQWEIISLRLNTPWLRSPGTTEEATGNNPPNNNWIMTS